MADLPVHEPRPTSAEDIRLFVRLILHGDDEHRRWLLEAGEAFIRGQPLPPARDQSGLKK